jgi:hypothetical protein
VNTKWENTKQVGAKHTHTSQAHQHHQDEEPTNGAHKRDGRLKKKTSELGEEESDCALQIERKR